MELILLIPGMEMAYQISETIVQKFQTPSRPTQTQIVQGIFVTLTLTMTVFSMLLTTVYM